MVGAKGNSVGDIMNEIHKILSNGINYACDPDKVKFHPHGEKSEKGELEGSQCPRCSGKEGYYFNEKGKGLWFCGSSDCLERDRAAIKSTKKRKYRYVS